MDKITKSFLAQFIKDSEIEDKSEDDQFEFFATDLVLAKNHLFERDIFESVVGNGGDMGLDAIAVSVNGRFVSDLDEIIEMEQNYNSFDVIFYFIQAKRTSGFEANTIDNITNGIIEFIDEDRSIPFNEEIDKWIQIQERIFSNARKFINGNPSCKIYYITTGKVSKDPNIDARITRAKKRLADQKIFSQIDFTLWGSDEIQKCYRETKNFLSREITFINRIAYPETSNVKEAYLGLLPATEFLKLISNDDNEIQKSIFFDNVRDWQGFNTVNSAIISTLSDASKSDKFSMLNNGITIIAKRIIPVGNKLTIENYQVVNGCQTSHAIFEARNALTSSVLVPLKLIVTESDDIIAQIIKSTNHQTVVKEDQLFALGEFHKKIESYFLARDADSKLFYERRLGQYDYQEGIHRARIISFGELLRSYAALILQEPHRTTRNYRGLLEKVGVEAFLDSHAVELYYLIASIYYQIDVQFHKNAIPKHLKPARFQLMMAYFILITNNAFPNIYHGRKFTKYCESIISRIWDITSNKLTLKDAIKCVERAANGEYNRDTIREKAFTETVISAAERKIRQVRKKETAH